jgi:hypothetical protein
MLIELSFEIVKEERKEFGRSWKMNHVNIYGSLSAKKVFITKSNFEG